MEKSKTSTLDGDSNKLFLDALKKSAKFAVHYRQACLDQNGTKKEICIPRKQGEIFSLIMEIVDSSKVAQVFEKIVLQVPTPYLLVHSVSVIQNLNLSEAL